MTITRNYLESLNTINEFCNVAADIVFLYAYQTNLERDFMAGWTNAMDMIDTGEMKNGDVAEFKRFALAEVRNFNEGSV